jgi:hypothetical protein
MPMPCTKMKKIRFFFFFNFSLKFFTETVGKTLKEILENLLGEGVIENPKNTYAMHQNEIFFHFCNFFNIFYLKMLKEL